MAKNQWVRHRVWVDRVEYPSLRAAFKALGLPQYQEPVCRGLLKAAGTLPYVAPDGRKILFVLGDRVGQKEAKC